MGAFDALNWPYSVKKVAVTPGYNNQTTGEWIPETTVETAISAHISDLSQKELVLLDPGLVATGVRKIAVESTIGLLVGNRIEITENSGEVTEWVVYQKTSSSGLLYKLAAINRDTFLLKRKI